MKRQTTILMLISWIISLEIFFLIVKAGGDGAGWFIGLFRCGQMFPWIAAGLALLGLHVAGYYVGRATAGGVARGVSYLQDHVHSAGRAPTAGTLLSPALLSALLVVLALGVMAATPAVRDDLQWLLAENRGTTQAVERYMDAWPAGRHADEAAVAHEKMLWQAASASHDAGAIRGYIAGFPQSERLAEAAALLEQFQWEDTQRIGTVASFREFVSDHPGSRFSGAAEARIDALLRDDVPFLNAQRVGTKEAFESFLASYPGHAREAQALADLSDLVGADIGDLLRDKRIEARVMGAGISSVNVRVRRLVDHPVAVRIPCGTFFAAAGSVQDMVGSEMVSTVLNDGQWRELSVPACCADRGADVPSSDDLFVIRSAPAGSELSRLMSTLSSSNADYTTKQAAVWIVTDDASYSQMGTLVSSHFGGIGGLRAIGSDQAVRAMHLCSRAGIDVRKKAIWEDRQALINAVSDPTLKQWLQERSRENVGT